MIDKYSLWNFTPPYTLFLQTSHRILYSSPDEYTFIGDGFIFIADVFIFIARRI